MYLIQDRRKFKMKPRLITESQLRNMIKEALEESLQEIAIDEKINLLRAKGSRRTLQETKQYRRLLEMKMEGMDEGSLGDMFSKVGSALGISSKFTPKNKKDLTRAIDGMRGFALPTFDIASISRRAVVGANWYKELANEALPFLGKFIPLLEELQKAQAEHEAKKPSKEEQGWMESQADVGSMELGTYLHHARNLQNLIGRYKSSASEGDIAAAPLEEPMMMTTKAYKKVYGDEGSSMKGLIAKYTN